MKIKQHTYWELEYSEANELIQQQFNKPDYEIVAEEEWCNDTDHTGIVCLKWYNEYDRKDVAHFINGTKPHKYWRCSWIDLFCHLAELGVIPEGDYLIQVYW